MLRRKPTYSINISSSSIQCEVVPGTVFNVVLRALNLTGCGVIAGRFYEYFFYLIQGRRGLKMKAAVALFYFASKP